MLKLRRDFSVGQVESTDGVFDIAFSSEAPVQREILDEFGQPILVNEILVHEGSHNADLTRINNGAALLFNHDFDKHLGKVIQGSVRIDYDRIGRAKVQFSQHGQLAQEVSAKVAEGTITKISFGYDLVEYEVQGENLLVTKWAPYEISFVTVPADDSVGLGRSLNINVTNKQINSKENKMAKRAKRIDEMSAEELEDMTIADIEELSDEDRAKREEMLEEIAEAQAAGEAEITATAAEDLANAGTESQEETELTAEEREEEIEEIEEIAERYRIGRGEVRKAIANNMTARQFKRSIKPSQTKAPAVIRTMQKDTQKNLETRFNLDTAFRSLLDGKNLRGAEAEYHQEMARKAMKRGAVARGIHIPVAALRAAPGGNVSASLDPIKQSVTRYDSFVELLLGPSVVDKLGVNVLSGLETPIAIPGMTESGTDSFGFVAENGESPEGKSEFKDAVLTPHTFTGGNPLSRQALMTMPNISGYIADHIVKFSRAKLEGLMFGSIAGGANAPESVIAQLTAVQSGMSYKEFLKFAAGLIDEGVDPSVFKYVMNGSMEADLMSTLRDSNVHDYIINDDRKLGGYDVVSTGRIAADKVLAGDFSGLTIAEWSGLSLDIDDTTYRSRGAIVPRVWCDLDWKVTDTQKLKLLEKKGTEAKAAK